MKFDLEYEGDLQADMRGELQLGRRAVTRSVKAAGRGLKTDLRNQITGAGLGIRLSRTIREQTYPKGGVSLRAASLVYSKADAVVHAFDQGVTIRSEDGFYLAIPLPAAGKKAPGGKRMTPGRWEKKTGRKLQFVYRRGKPPLLVDVGKIHKFNYMNRAGEHKRRRQTRQKKSVPMFILVRSVKMPKKLSVQAAAQRAQTRLAQLVIQNWG